MKVILTMRMIFKMKKLFLIFFISSLCLAEPKPRRYDHILGEDGKILASIDTEKDNQIEYKVDPKLVVTRLLKTIGDLQAQCNQIVQRYESEKAESKKWFWQK